MLVEFVDDDAGGLAALEFEDDAGLFVGFVAQVGDFVEGLVLHQRGDVLREGGAVDVVGDLRDDDLLLAGFKFLRVAFAAHVDDAAAGAQITFDTVAPGDHAAGGKVGPRDELDQLVHAEVRVVHDGTDAVNQLAEVVRRDVGGHADGDARRAVHEQIGEAGGEDGRLGGFLVVIGAKLDGVLVNAAQEFLGDFGEPALGIAVGGGRVAVHGAEIALGVHERVGHDPGLGHAHERVVNRAVAVGVVSFQHFADDARALRRGAIVQQAFAQHGVKDATLDGLEAVASVRQGARDDDRHRVIDVGRLHDVRNAGGLKFFLFRIHEIERA